MDGQRFDNVVRSFARRGSRRSLLGGLAGSGALFLAAHLRLLGAAARRGTKSAGEACWDDDQCVAADTALVCAWNGFGSAGAACCAYDGSRCADDFGCCGTSVCIDGWCTSGGSASPGPGDPCQPGVDVCVAAAGAFGCDYAGSTGDYRCCAYAGDRCGWDGQCCGGNTCVGGICASGGGGCTGYGCDCWQGPNDGNPCDAGLVCCLDSDTHGTCLPQYTCTGTGAPGDACPQYCLPGPTQCPSCVSGYCTPMGYCG
jgi:hypothetical protein